MALNQQPAMNLSSCCRRCCCNDRLAVLAPCPRTKPQRHLNEGHPQQQQQQQLLWRLLLLLLLLLLLPLLLLLIGWCAWLPMWR